MAFLSLFFLLLSPDARSAPAAAPLRCEGPLRSFADALTCADQLSPEILKANSRLNTARLEVGARGQWRNPELSLNTFAGSIAGSRQVETDLVLGVPIELGGKAGARRAVGEALVAQAEAELLAARARVRSEMILGLHRLRQLKHEIEVVGESVAAFTTLNKQYGSRSQLSPEQQISATVYRLAKSQSELRRADILDEVSSLNAYFKLTLNKGETELTGILPPAPRTWPKLEDQNRPMASPRLVLAAAGSKLAEAGKARERSESWPTLTAGPSYRRQTQGTASGDLLGFNVSLPLPLFNANGAGRVAAAANLEQSLATERLELSSEEGQRERLASTYRQSVALLDTTLSHAEIERVHHEIDGLFKKGVAPSALVIEAHRSYLELELSRHARERKAIETLLALYEIDGTILEKSL
ncbi:MAG: TolC family protein [Proteobacteria bacterium]|nr:MAG: TolC family protein [Pseudomonadota bacterium]